MVLAVLTGVQLLIAYLMNSGWIHGKISNNEVALWTWTAILRFYLVHRSNVLMPSPSPSLLPHLRVLYTVGLLIDFIRLRTELLAYARDAAGQLPIAELAMAGIATILLLVSIFQQQQVNGLPSNLAAGESGTGSSCHEQRATIAQNMFFSWLDPMIWLGYKRPLEPNDLYDLMPEDHAKQINARWQSE
ncbi:Transporter of the ATP-binding cassette (ABC), partial [Coemansia guatemalensis]